MEDIDKIIGNEKVFALLRRIHKLMHIMDAQDMIKKASSPGSDEKVGLSDEVEIKIIRSNSIKSQEVK
jgi:hypothetical protein